MANWFEQNFWEQIGQLIVSWKGTKGPGQPHISELYNRVDEKYKWLKHNVPETHITLSEAIGHVKDEIKQ